MLINGGVNNVIRTILPLINNNTFVKSHSLNTAENTVKLVEFFISKGKLSVKGLEYADFVYLSFLGAFVHDIGKLCLSDDILLKQSILTSLEAEEMRLHPLNGEKRLSSLFHKFEESDVTNLIVGVALHHHEKWDGGGYPHGLKGEDIPVMARIVAIADAYDAIRSWRPYKPEKCKGFALLELEKGAGSHFDPNLVDVLLEGIKEDSFSIE